MAVQIVPMTKQDIPEAVECVQTAFADDPYFHWLFNSSEVSSVQKKFHIEEPCIDPERVINSTMSNATPPP
jgi:hypothetical protein